MTFYIEVLCTTYSGNASGEEWRKLHPSNGPPYAYATREAAALDLRRCYPPTDHDTNKTRIVESLI